MKRIVGILIQDPDNPFMGMPLLGKPCSQYVEQAMADAGVAIAAARPANGADLHPLLAADVQAVLLTGGNAPCLADVTYRALSLAAKERAAAVLLADMATPLALGMPAGMLQSLPKKMPLTLSSLMAWLNAQNQPVKVVHAQDPSAYLAVTDAATYTSAFQFLRAETVRRHMAAGVVILEPERTIIEADVRIGAGTILYPGNTLQGGTVIGASCTLYSGNRIESSIIGDGVTIENSVLLRCKVGSRTTVGPFAYLRPDANIGEHCRIGDFVEIKNSTIDDCTKVSHLTYVGDSDLGKHINLGCGVVFVNYDGKSKSRSRVDDNAFIGCNCNLVAPVHVGENAYIAAGSTVVEDVPSDALFVARSRGVIKEDWVKRRKEQGKL